MTQRLCGWARPNEVNLSRAGGFLVLVAKEDSHASLENGENHMNRNMDSPGESKSD